MTIDDQKSKTQKKKEVKGLQDLGETLVMLSPEHLKSIPLPGTLFSAITDAQAISRHGARRRQLQYIGKLMRDVDPVPILQALENIRHGDYKKARQYSQIIKWRDKLKDGNLEIIDEIILKYPESDRQRLAQLVRNALKKDKARQKKKASDALFKYLQEITANAKPSSGMPPKDS